jgi:hypothetical protein
MPLPYSTPTIERQGTSSDGALQTNWNKHYNPNLSVKDNDITLVISPKELTDDSSKLGLEEYVKRLDSQKGFQNSAFREIFFHRGVANFQFLQDSGTSSIYPPAQIVFYLHKFSDEIKPCLDKLFLVENSENTLYKIADSAAKWFIDVPDAYHVFIVSYLHDLPLLPKRILLAALSDAEFLTKNKELIRFTGSFLSSSDKRLAQTTANFLLTCCENLGKTLLQEILDNETIPHSKLVKGIVELIGT